MYFCTTSGSFCTKVYDIKSKKTVTIDISFFHLWCNSVNNSIICLKIIVLLLPMVTNEKLYYLPGVFGLPPKEYAGVFSLPRGPSWGSN